MNKIRMKVIDPAKGVAPVSVATSLGQPGGRRMTEADVPELLKKGTPVDEVAALQLVSLPRLDQIVSDLAKQGLLPSEPVSFRR